jgi:protein SCO1/2
VADAVVSASRRRLLAVLVAGMSLAACDRLTGKAGAPAFHSTDITGAEFARRLELPDADGRARTLADWKGKVVIVFFGYTQCPDFCPTTLAELAQIKKSLGAEGDRVQVVFVTVDPERDTPQVLKAYVANFGAGVVGLRGSLEQTAAVAQEFKVFYAKVPGKTPGSYSMDHSAASFVFDPSGRARLYVPYGGDPKAFADDLRLLLASPAA